MCRTVSLPRGWSLYEAPVLHRPTVDWPTVAAHVTPYRNAGDGWARSLDLALTAARVRCHLGDPDGVAAEVAAAMVADPRRVAAMVGSTDPYADPAQRLRHLRGIETYDEQERRRRREQEERRRQWEARLHGRSPADRERTTRSALMVSAEARADYGLSLGGRRAVRAMKGLSCPGCGDRSAWFWIQPGRFKGARCNHRARCGWFGHIEELQHTTTQQR